MKQRLTNLTRKIKAINAILKTDKFFVAYEEKNEAFTCHSSMNKPFVEAIATYLTDKLKLAIMEKMASEMDSAVDEVNNILTKAE